MNFRIGHRDPLLGGGTFGFGFGAVLDVVVFHLILQWHHLLSAVYTPATKKGLKANIYSDGIFSLAMLGVMVVGAGLLWRAANRADDPYSTVRVLGSVLVGVGLFNLFDGIVDHYVLNIHHVTHGSRVLNPHWVGASALVLGVGVLVVKKDTS